MDYELEELTTSNGHKIKAFKGDYITKKIKEQGLYEKLTLDFIRRYLANISSPVVADIGANIGNHALDFSTYAKKVYAFEPVGVTYNALLGNINNNNVLNVVAVNKALSDRAGSDKIYLREGNIGASSIIKKGISKENIHIEKIVGDDFFEHEELDALHFLKIDVEGHEKYALKGMMKTIRKFRPLIMMEWNEKEAVANFNSEGLLDELCNMYDIKVLGNNRDLEYWQGRMLSGLRRKMVKMFWKRQVRLYPFESNKTYRNLLLIPKSR